MRPDDEDKSFIARWNLLTRILLVEPSVNLVARTAMDHANFEDGGSCHPSNELLARETGYDEKTIRFAWAVMRGLKMAERVAHGVAYRRLADEYQLLIPANWDTHPILGPHCGKFACLHCGKLFNPQGNCTVNGKGDKPDTVRFNIVKLSFCAAPRRKNGRPGADCFSLWNQQRIKEGSRPWGKLDGEESWKLFRQARNDEW